MTGFAVDVAALQGLPPLLDRLGQDAAAGKRYLRDNTTIEYGVGLLNTVKGNHEHVVRQVRFFLEDIATYTAAQTSSALRQALRYYTGTDTASAARLDGTYRGAQVDRSQFVNYYRLPATGPAFTDRCEPSAAYQPIPDYNTDADFAFNPQLWDIASPTSAVRDTVWAATWLATELGICDRPYDPYESLVKPLSGDWAAVRGCADVLANIAVALDDMAANVRAAAMGIDGVWTGQAASGCQAHLVWSAAKMHDAAAPLLELATQYKTTATSMFEIGKVIGSLISDLVDAALIFITEASLAVATSETVIGSVLFGAAALYEGYKIVDLIKESLDLVGRADSLVSAFNAAAGDFGLVDAADQLPILTPPPDLPK